MSCLRLAQIRAVPEKGALDANHARLMQILGALSRERVDVVVTPECFLDGYVCVEDSVTRETLRDYAIDPATSAYVRSAASWARDASAWLVVGCSRIAAGAVYNSALVIDRQGALCGIYDKTHCQAHDRKYAAGQAIPVFESDFGRFGVMICADRRWPETVRSLAVQGARVIFNPTYGMHDERNLHLMQTRSYESEVFIAFTHPRQSLVTDPRGHVVCNDVDEGISYAVTEVDLSEADAVRARPSAHLRDRRTDIYLS